MERGLANRISPVSPIWDGLQKGHERTRGGGGEASNREGLGNCGPTGKENCERKHDVKTAGNKMRASNKKEHVEEVRTVKEGGVNRSSYGVSHQICPTVTRRSSYVGKLRAVKRADAWAIGGQKSPGPG